ncbi:MAG: hypothetical protein IBV52_04055 [Candidatus Bathyarchaeota archaeon]
MEVEKEIISYLYKYGNTKESDIINYGVKKFNHSSERMKKVIRRMVIKGKIHYLVHSKLEPPEAYISLEEPLPPESAQILLGASIQTKKVEETARKILEEAAAVAERKIKERYGKRVRDSNIL